MSEAAATSCPKCGAAIPPEAPQGLCPKCLLQQASFPTETGPTTRHSRPAPPDRDELAAAFPHLQILELIGQGGMGFVYKARQPKLDRLVALKILAQPLAEQTHFAERFTREGRTLAKLNHPNIVTIHDFGQAGPFFYLLMEYVDGVNLRQAMRAGAINSSQALAIVPRICEALQYAHNEGVLHRDIKPDNILLDTRGRVKIADFGIAKLMAEAVAENPLTGSGASLGTPHYMAPEQIEKPNAVDHRADIYSLGVVFYEMLTGELPLGRFAAPSEKSAIDPRLDDVVFQTLEKQPERRPQSADEVKTRVETISAGPQHAEPSEGQVAFKMSKCYLTTPQFLSSRIGRFLRYTNKGELRLDEETLTFAPRHQNWIVIPLRAITSLSMGEFPAGIGKIKFISITFTEKGNTHRFFFIPTRGAFRSIWNTNQLVEEWFTAIVHAAKARTGRIPPSFKDDIDPLPSTSSSKASLSSALLKGALTLALVVILGLGVGLGAFIGLYALLRHSNPRQSATAATEDPLVLTSNTTPTGATIAQTQPQPISTTGPTKTLNLAYDYFGPSPEHNINFKSQTDLAGDEQITTVIAYNDEDFSDTHYNATWTSDDRLLKLHWPIPENFSIPFDLEPVVKHFFNRKSTIPVRLATNAPTALFTVTNALHQRITCGIRYDILPSTNTSNAILSHIGFRQGGGGVELVFQSAVPPGMMLVACSDFQDSPRPIRITRDMSDPTFVATWPYPDRDFYTSAFNTTTVRGVPTLPFFSEPFTTKSVTVTTNPIPVFAVTNANGKVFRGFMALAPASATNIASIFANLPAPPNVAAPTQGETLDLTFVGAILEPRKLTLRAKGFVTLDDNIDAITGHPEISQPFTRVPPPRDAASENYSMWVCSRGLTNDEFAEFIWTFPVGYSAEDDFGPAVARFFEGSQPSRKRVQLIADKTTKLFTITNAFGEVTECGLRFNKRPAAVKDSNAGVIITGVSGSGDYKGINLDLDAAFPKGAGIEAFGQAEDKSGATILTRSLQGNSLIHVVWLFPDGYLVPQLNTTTLPDSSRPSPNAKPTPDFLQPMWRSIQAGSARVTPSPLEIFAITNSNGKIFRGSLQISYHRDATAKNPNPPETSQNSSQPAAGPNGASRAITANFAHLPLMTNSPTKTLDSETLELTMFRPTIEPRKIILHGHAMLTLDETILAATTQPAPPQQQAPQRIPPQNTSMWRSTRGLTNEDDAEFVWNFNEPFSLERDLTPAVERFFSGQKFKKVRLTAGKTTSLFSITNAFGEIADCGLMFMKLIASVKDANAGVIVLAASGNANDEGVSLGADIAFPEGVQIEASGQFDGKPTDAVLQRPFSKTIQVSWRYPDGFTGSSANETKENPGPIPLVRNRGPVHARGASFGDNTPPFLRPFYQRIEAGDARITPAEPLEIFAVTNAEGKVFHGTLQMSYGRGDGPRSTSIPSATTPKKSFEFTSVTNSDDYIVLQSETPLEVGKNLVALIEDSTGKTNRSVSGTTVRHNASETIITTQLMWKMPDGSPTNWIQSTIQKLREQIIAKPIQFSEGETTRLFDLRSTPDSVQQFAAVRYETVRPAEGQNSAVVRVRSATAINTGLILNFDADVPPGYRLEADTDPNNNGDEARLHCSNIGGKNHYNALWTFENLRGQNLADLREALTNRASRIIPEKFSITAGKSQPILTFQTTSGDEFPAILKLSAPK